MLADCWEPEELKEAIESEDEETKVEGCWEERYATVVGKSAKQFGTCISLRHEWLPEFICIEMGKIYHSFIAELWGENRKLPKLGCLLDYNTDVQK